MPTITLSMPNEIKQEMDKRKFINWSEVARESIKEKISELKLLEDITSKSKLTEKDALEIGRKINKSLRKERDNETSN
jgi:Arc/MetJ-type ribon-helix-helix transcriptional regulator